MLKRDDGNGNGNDCCCHVMKTPRLCYYNTCTQRTYLVRRAAGYVVVVTNGIVR